MTQMQWLTLFEHIGIWGSVIVPVLFFIQYTLLAKWWKNPMGRSIIALDLCIELVAVPLWVALTFPKWTALHVLPFDWMLVIGLVGVPLVALYRMLVWERLRHLRKRVTDVNGD